MSTRRRRWSGRRDSNPRPTAWKAVTLPLSYSRPGAERIDREWWRREDSNLGRAKPGRFTVCCHCPLGHTSEFLDCQRPTVTRRQRIGWSRHSDLNRGPTAYKAVALPLSYAGVTSRGPRSHGSSGADPPPCQGVGIVDGGREDGKGKRGRRRYRPLGDSSASSDCGGLKLPFAAFRPAEVSGGRGAGRSAAYLLDRIAAAVTQDVTVIEYRHHYEQ